MTVQKVDVLVIGAGPTGLGAATRLHQHGSKEWLLVDAEPEAGGLACTDLTPEGFLFDMGGHVIFSHYQYFDELLNTAYGDGPERWNTLQRVSYVWIKGRWVAYPFQNNISALDTEDQIKCLTGLIEAKVANQMAVTKPKNFDEWILRVMGEGIADLFMRPYNFKVWAIQPSGMQCDWLGERVATVDVTRAITNVLHNKEDAGWGPNAVFRFPLEGGTGGIWKAVAAKLPQDRLKLGSGSKVTSIDKDTKTASLADGSQLQYESLLTTMPLDLTLQWLGKPDWAAELTHSTSHIIGVGVRGHSPHETKCWLYFPEDDCPFYRTTVFSHYAPKNCPTADKQLRTVLLGDGTETPDSKPEAGPYWSLMFEVSESEVKPVNQEEQNLAGGKWPALVQETIQGAVNTSLLLPTDQIVSIFYRRIEHGYPTPSVARDAALDKAQPWLREHNIWSRGRFGSYKYEVANQDHSLMLGVEAVDNILFGTREVTLCNPGIVNAKKNTDLRYLTAKRAQG